MPREAGNRRASRTILVQTAKRAARGGALWGIVFGLLIASSATSYVSAFPDAASRAEVAASIQGNAGFEALFGIIRGVDTVAGYTAYKTLYTMIILGAIWGLLTSTRLLRGEEDAGRWELYLSGSAWAQPRTSPPRLPPRPRCSRPPACSLDSSARTVTRRT
jgi:putative exporter of polyketide antibiotics